MKAFHYLLLATIIGHCWAAYDESLAMELARLAGSSYCHPDLLKSLTCGPQCDYISKSDWKLFSSQVYTVMNESFSFSTFSNEATEQFVLAFRGTVGIPQFLAEAADKNSSLYDLQPLEAPARVANFFYLAYKYALRGAVLEQVNTAKAAYPDYSFVITGHSLGAALATIATVDLVKLELLDGEDLKVYTFGSPRVGDFAFATLFNSLVGESYRVVHYRDSIPHVAPCFGNATLGECYASSNETDTVWFPWHTNLEVFYGDSNMTLGSYKICHDEDKTCSDQYSLNNTNLNDHFFYLAPSGCFPYSEEKSTYGPINTTDIGPFGPISVVKSNLVKSPKNAKLSQLYKLY